MRGRLWHRRLLERAIVREIPLHDSYARGLSPRGFFHGGFATKAAPHEYNLIVLKRAGMRLLLGNAEIRKQF
jgi:hypothetical protein